MSPDFVKAMYAVADLLDAEMTQTKVEGYWIMLQHYGEAQLIEALSHAAITEKRFPVPARLIEILEGEDPATEAGAQAAWVAVMRCLSTPQVYDLERSDPRIAAGITAAGGTWLLRTGADDEAMIWKQRKFVQAFMGTGHEIKRIRGRGGEPTAIGKLLGVGGQPALLSGQPCEES